MRKSFASYVSVFFFRRPDPPGYDGCIFFFPLPIFPRSTFSFLESPGLTLSPLSRGTKRVVLIQSRTCGRFCVSELYQVECLCWRVITYPLQFFLSSSMFVASEPLRRFRPSVQSFATGSEALRRPRRVLPDGPPLPPPPMVPRPGCHLQQWLVASGRSRLILCDFYTPLPISTKARETFFFFLGRSV